MPMHPQDLTCIFVRHHAALLRYVSGAFPRVCRGRVEDAVADAFTICLSNLGMVDQARARGGERSVVALIRVIAWRCARATSCRGAAVWESAGDALDWDPGQASDQEYVTDMRLHLPAALLAAAKRVLPSAPDRLADAVMDRLMSGETDGIVAARHGLRREYINGARLLLEQAVMAEMD